MEEIRFFISSRSSFFEGADAAAAGTPAVLLVEEAAQLVTLPPCPCLLVWGSLAPWEAGTVALFVPLRCCSLQDSLVHILLTLLDDEQRMG